MNHQCDRHCECREDLDRAANRLAEASKMLSVSVSIHSDELIENYYAMVRAAKARFQGARAVYLEHRRNTA